MKIKTDLNVHAGKEQDTFMQSVNEKENVTQQFLPLRLVSR